MTYPARILDELEKLRGSAWQGEVWRHMFGSNRPEMENIRGSRWNPRDIPAIYTSLEEATARAEGDFMVAMQPIAPRAARHLYRIRVRLANVIDLRDPVLLRAVGVDDSDLRSLDYSACQTVGGAANWLGHDGILVPSARAVGSNLVILTQNTGDVSMEFTVLESRQIQVDAR
jgi:RES domain-containing protein